METRQGNRLVWWWQRRPGERSTPPPLGTTVTVDLNAAASATAPTSEPTAEIPARSPVVIVDHPTFTPPFVGTRVVSRMLIDEIVGYVNELELFRTHWQLEPGDNEDEVDFRLRHHALFREQLSSAKKQELLVPQVAYGYFPANSEGTDVILWDDETRTRERARITFPRRSDSPGTSVADYVKPAGRPDYVAIQIASMGDRISLQTIGHYAGATRETYMRYYALGLALRDALTEYWHRRIRIDWGFADNDGPSLALLLRGFYRGGRYPVEGNEAVVAELLEADRIGVSVSAESPDRLRPDLTAAALIVHHPQAVGERSGASRAHHW